MPELPDLLYTEKYLRRHVLGKRIKTVSVKQPIVIRVLTPDSFTGALTGKTFKQVRIRGPFLHFMMSANVDLIMNFMLTGRIQHQQPQDRPRGDLCFSLSLDDESSLNFLDDQKMGKVYLTEAGNYSRIPRFVQQGIDVRSPAFTVEKFQEILEQNRRKQVHVLLIDQTILSSIGHAYADEILFDAGIHPKTWVRDLTEKDAVRLHDSILSVLRWGTRKVEEAQQPIHVKVRNHMKVRLRHGKPCLHCGTTIRREGVRGWDVFFCPTCQPASRKLFIDWNRTIGSRSH